MAARSLKEISDYLKESFISNPGIQEMYNLTPGKTFDSQFSKVSLESVLIYIFAMSSWVLEQKWDVFRNEIEHIIDNSYVTSIPWYYKKALEFQLNDSLVFNEKTYSYEYAKVDEEKRIVKNVAIREVVEEGQFPKLKICFSDKDKQPLGENEKKAFEVYMREIGAAGTHFEFVSKEPDELQFNITIYYNPLFIDPFGKRLDNSEQPVDEAINNYLNNLEYGGTFYASKLMDSIQLVEGVEDVCIEEVNKTKENRKIDAVSGSFVYNKDSSTINYTKES